MLRMRTSQADIRYKFYVSYAQLFEVIEVRDSHLGGAGCQSESVQAVAAPGR